MISKILKIALCPNTNSIKLNVALPEEPKNNLVVLEKIFSIYVLMSNAAKSSLFSSLVKIIRQSCYQGNIKNI